MIKGSGATVAPLMVATGKQPIVVGKPEAVMLQEILETLSK
jgi:ribonucleotide monophosphatase NagD (HAD superfamily)